VFGSVREMKGTHKVGYRQSATGTKWEWDACSSRRFKAPRRFRLHEKLEGTELLRHVAERRNSVTKTVKNAVQHEVCVTEN